MDQVFHGNIAPESARCPGGSRLLWPGAKRPAWSGYLPGEEPARCFLKEDFPKTGQRILMVGLDGAGKTTILYNLAKDHTEVVTSIPTIGFNVETITHKNVSFTVWDNDGQDRIRPLWRHHYLGMQGLIFVVDSTDRNRIEDARKELMQMLSEDELRGAPLLVFANKKDLPNAMPVAEVTEKLGLHSIEDRQWEICRVCATKDEFLYKGLKWLSSKISTRR